MKMIEIDGNWFEGFAFSPRALGLIRIQKNPRLARVLNEEEVEKVIEGLKSLGIEEFKVYRLTPDGC